MSSKQYEINRKQGFYSTLSSTSQYTCPSKSLYYKDFNNGENCLCTSDARTSFDKKMQEAFGNGRNKSPVLPPESSKSLGW